MSRVVLERNQSLRALDSTGVAARERSVGGQGCFCDGQRVKWN